MTQLLQVTAELCVIGNFLFGRKPFTGFHSTLQGNKNCVDNNTF